jgi:hypothetical protein
MRSREWKRLNGNLNINYSRLNIQSYTGDNLNDRRTIYATNGNLKVYKKHSSRY